MPRRRSNAIRTHHPPAVHANGGTARLRRGSCTRSCRRSPCRESIMANKMLIDASHPEETRVVVVRGQKVEEFDFESASRRQLRGNIYLAKVTRVEPSLQAAFVEYGGNRHGFLAFSEIHPDYYQIPTADRQALLEAEAQAARDEEEEDERRRSRRRPGASKRARTHASVSAAPDGENAPAEHESSARDGGNP